MPLRKRPNSDPSVESLEARLRGLPPPSVPSDLQARLLEAIPSKMREITATSRSWRPAIWSGAAIGLAAACVLAMFLFSDAGTWTTTSRTVVVSKSIGSSGLVRPEQSTDSFGAAPWSEARRGVDASEWRTFVWPIHEKTPLMVSLAIPPDLLE
jgi:hypothetical protein